MRAFLAFELPQFIKEYLQDVVKRMSVENVRWVRDDGYHITLKFFGEIEEQKALKIQERVKAIQKEYHPFEAQLKEIDAFPTRRKARVIVVTLEKGIDNMQRIFNDIEEKIVDLHIEREGRTYKPHITLGRRKIPIPILEREIFPLEQKVFKVQTLMLVQSKLTQEGAHYTPLWGIELGGGNGERGKQ